MPWGRWEKPKGPKPFRALKHKHKAAFAKHIYKCKHVPFQKNSNSWKNSGNWRTPCACMHMYTHACTHALCPLNCLWSTTLTGLSFNTIWTCIAYSIQLGNSTIVSTGCLSCKMGVPSDPWARLYINVNVTQVPMILSSLVSWSLILYHSLSQYPPFFSSSTKANSHDNLHYHLLRKAALTPAFLKWQRFFLLQWEPFYPTVPHSIRAPRVLGDEPFPRHPANMVWCLQ